MAPDPLPTSDSRSSTAPAGHHIALIGMMAAGKTTVGREVARRCGVRFVDTDDEIEAETGETVGDLWERHGEEGYRPLERAAVLQALRSTRPVVLATPGGVVVDPAMAEAVARADVDTVYLRASARTLAGRVGGDDHRPLLGDDPGTAIVALLRERAGRYKDLADVIIDVDDRSPDEVAGAVLVAVAS